MAEDLIAGLTPVELGRRLKDARGAAQKTQEEVAQFLGVARTTITAIEKGDRRLRSSELLRLASYYGKQVSDLVKQVSSASPLAMQLRAVFAPGSDFESAVQPYGWQLQHLSEDYAELERICESPLTRHYPTERSIRGLVPETAAEAFADAERNRLGLGDGPIHRLRDTLEQEVGLRIFYIPMQHQIAAMFAFDEVLGGCIAVNQNHPEARRRLSLAHEYAHFLASRLSASVDVAARYQRLPEQERFAVAFAPAFLMPATGVSRRFSELKAAGNGKFRYADLLTLAHYFGVSFESLAKRLEYLRLISRGAWERIKESGFRPQEAKSILHLVEQPVQADLLPTRYLVLALQGYHDGLITEGQFARFLRVDLLEARRLAEQTLGDRSAIPMLSEKSIDRPGLAQ